MLVASRGERRLVEERKPSRDTAAIGFYVTLFLRHHVLNKRQQHHRERHKHWSFLHCGVLGKEKQDLILLLIDTNPVFLAISDHGHEK